MLKTEELHPFSKDDFVRTNYAGTFNTNPRKRAGV